MKKKGGMCASAASGACLEAVALAGWRPGRSLREIAVERYGRKEVEVCRLDDNGMRSKLRWLLSRAGARGGTETDAGREEDTGPASRDAAQ